MTSLQSTRSRHARPVARMRIAMLGTRGPLADGDGIERAVEEVGRRLAQQGHEITVYGGASGADAPREHLGMHLVDVPALHVSGLETLSRTALSSAHFSAGHRHDVAFLFGAANSPFIPLIRSRAAAVALHVGGLEWNRERRGRWSRRYLRVAERFAVREADALIADAPGIADYYDDEFGVPTETITYGCRVLTHTPSDAIESIGLVPGSFHLVVARFEPEHHLDVVLEGYRRSDALLPLVVVGSAARTRNGIVDPSAGDPRIRMLGDVADPRLLDQLHAHAASSVHGTSLGGTDPALLRAMGAGTAVICWDVVFNRDVAGVAGSYFSSPAGLTRCVEEVERYPARFRDIGELMQERASKRYDWDSVAEAYEAVAAKLARGHSTRGLSSGRRTGPARSREAVALEAHRA